MKRNILRRVRILYWVLISFIAIVLLWQMTAFAYGFTEGIVGAMEQLSKKDKEYVVAPFVPVKDGFDLSIDSFDEVIAATLDSSVVLRASVASYNVMIEKNKGTSLPLERLDTTYGILTFLLLIIYVTIVVFLFKVLASIKRSLNQNTVFSRKVIRYTRWVGALLIICSLFLDVATYLHNLHVVSVMEICGDANVELSAGFPVDSYMGIITGVMILFFAEVFAIGYDMSEEQKLTI